MLQAGPLQGSIEKTHIIVFQKKGPINVEFRRYPLTKNRRQVNGINKLIAIGDYHKKSLDRLTEDIQIFRKAKHWNYSFSYLSIAAYALIQQNNCISDYITHVPQSSRANFLISDIVKDICSRLGSEYMEPQNLFQYNSSKHITMIKNTSEKRKESKIEEFFKAKRINSKSGSILIIDDIIDTGKTLSRIGKILSGYGYSVNGFCWLISTGDPEL